MGDVISIFAEQNPEIDISVFCGHTHSNARFKPRKNMEIRAGAAQYYNPILQEIILL